MQNGSIMRSERQRGPDVWEYRWREPGPDGRRKHRRIVVGSVIQFRDKDAAIRATSALRRDINMANVRSKGKPITLSQLADHYSQRELAPNSRWKTHSTKLGYKGYLRKWIIPRWGGHRLTHIRAGEIELWLRSLPLARSSCAKIRNVMSVLLNHGRRHELIDRNPVQWYAKVPKGRRSPRYLKPKKFNCYSAPSMSASAPWSCSMSSLITGKRTIRTQMGGYRFHQERDLRDAYYRPASCRPV